jgi:hypothetical protein
MSPLRLRLHPSPLLEPHSAPSRSSLFQSTLLPLESVDARSSPSMSTFNLRMHCHFWFRVPGHVTFVAHFFSHRFSSFRARIWSHKHYSRDVVLRLVPTRIVSFDSVQQSVAEEARHSLGYFIRNQKLRHLVPLLGHGSGPGFSTMVRFLDHSPLWEIFSDTVVLFCVGNDTSIQAVDHLHQLS